jgi:phosphate starvation-inducible PhoH-like protein
LIDECQNMSFHELDSIITRMGRNCRVIFCGDFRQADLKQNQSGMKDFMQVLKRMELFDFIDFQVEDIVRSDFVKSYIIAKNELEL